MKSKFCFGSEVVKPFQDVKSDLMRQLLVGLELVAEL
jgi:hypothetical protein